MRLFSYFWRSFLETIAFNDHCCRELWSPFAFALSPLPSLHPCFSWISITFRVVWLFHQRKCYIFTSILSASSIRIFLFWECFAQKKYLSVLVLFTKSILHFWNISLTLAVHVILLLFFCCCSNFGQTIELWECLFKPSLCQCTNEAI